MFIYKTTNLVNGKIYIGQHCGTNPAYLGSGKLLKAAIKKYGQENFKREILEYCDNVDHMNEREIIWIARYDSINPLIGYNLARGGGGLTEESIKKMSESQKGRKLSEKHRKKISEANKGKNFSEETRKKLSEAFKGRKRGPMSEEQKKKLSESSKKSQKCKESLKMLHKSNIGRIRSEETKKKMSEAHQNMSEETRKKMSEWQKGRKLSEETRKKMSESRKGKKYGAPSGETRKKISETLKIKVIQLTLDGLKVKIWDGATDAGDFGFHRQNITKCCKGRLKTHKGFKWMYLHEYEKGLNND